MPEALDSPQKEREITILFLSNLSDKIGDFTRHIDTQANILIAASTGVLVLAVSELTNSSHKFLPTLITLIIFSAAADILGLLAIHPPKSMRKKKQRESLLYNKKIARFETADKYSEALETCCETPESMFKEFSLEIYNLARYYYRPKRKLFNYARSVFLAGIIVSMIVIVISAFVF